MRHVQILINEEMLADLDADDQVKTVGRSKVLRRLVAAYLESRREARLDAQYRRGYDNHSDVNVELEDWSEEGLWPDD
jgi:metal-responsive CopG/Arc/MetJ family transcriptional regulator